MAKLYETVVIVDAMIPEEAIESEFSAIEDHISSKGRLLKTDKWGKRKLAYEIKGRSHGEYNVFYYEAEGSLPAELEKRFRINENILRWLTVADNPAGVPREEPEASEKGAAQGVKGAKPEDKSVEKPEVKAGDNPEDGPVEKQRDETEKPDKENEENVQALKSEK